MSKPTNEVIERYRSKTYDRISLTVVKGQRELLDHYASIMGVSRNDLICDALTKYLGHKITGHVE